MNTRKLTTKLQNEKKDDQLIPSEISFFRERGPSQILFFLILLLPFSLETRVIGFFCYLMFLFKIGPEPEDFEEKLLFAAQSRELKFSHHTLLYQPKEVNDLPFLESEDSQICRYQDDQLEELKEYGTNYGLMIIWYAAKRLGFVSELFDGLNEIARKAQSDQDCLLSCEQEELVEYIAEIQSNPETTAHLSGANSEFIISPKKESQRSIYIDDEKGLPHLAEEAIEFAISNLGLLVELRLQKDRESHYIGIVAEKNGEGLIITVFDTNYPLKPFKTKQQAIDLLHIHLKYRYQSYFDTKYDFPNVLLKLHIFQEIYYPRNDLLPNLFNDRIWLQDILKEQQKRASSNTSLARVKRFA